MFTYSIHITPFDYPVSLNDSGAKIVFETDDNGVIFRERLDGNFTFNRTGNAVIYDKIMALTYCEQGILTCTDVEGNIVQSSFMKKDLTISEDKCLISIKFDKYDEYNCLDGILDVEFDILKGRDEVPYANKNVNYSYTQEIEYSIGTGVLNRNSYFIVGGHAGRWVDINGNKIFFPPAASNIFYPLYTSVEEQPTYTLYKNEIKLVGDYLPGGNNEFEITSYFVRAVRTYRRTGTDREVPALPDPEDCNQNEWYWVATTTNPSGDTFDTFVRAIPTENWVDGVPQNEHSIYTITRELSCATSYIINFNRGKRLNDVINALIYDCFPQGFVSDFFKNNVNPISGRDLSNLVISQKSDIKNPLSTDPATKGIITFKKLMSYLQAMFNVYWAIDDNGDLRIEHKKYWDNNGSYTVSNAVDIDLTVIYPMSLYGTNEYTFEINIPIAERFEFMDASNLDFVGEQINYRNCIKKGDVITYSASEISTDIEYVYLNTDVSKEGFCLFHCGIYPVGIFINGEWVYPLEVISEQGVLSFKSIPNAHLSWANLQDSYWKYDRYLPSGIMNGVTTDFDVRALKYQKQITFPYCFGEFHPQRLIRTGLGDGIVKSAEFSFKTNWITVELKYKDIL